MLGIAWNSQSDIFSYAVNVNMKFGSPLTKRTVLSSVAQIFDLLGLVGPTILKAKIFMQHLWQLQLSWDQQIPEDLQVAWFNFI